MIKPNNRAFARGKIGQPRSARGNAFPLWWLSPPPCPVGSMSLDSRVAYSSPMNPVPLPPPQFGGATKGKRLNGQARRLSSPHLEVLCRTSTGDNKAPLCCELLMKGLLFRALFCPRLRGKSGAAGKGEASAASQSAECQSSPMTLKVNPVTLTLCSSPVRAIPQPSARRAVKLKNLPAHRAGPS